MLPDPVPESKTKHALNAKSWTQRFERTPFRPTCILIQVSQTSEATLPNSDHHSQPNLTQSMTPHLPQPRGRTFTRARTPIRISLRVPIKPIQFTLLRLIESVEIDPRPFLTISKPDRVPLKVLMVPLLFFKNTRRLAKHRTPIQDAFLRACFCRRAEYASTLPLDAFNPWRDLQ